MATKKYSKSQFLKMLQRVYSELIEAENHVHPLINCLFALLNKYFFFTGAIRSRRSGNRLNPLKIVKVMTGFKGLCAEKYEKLPQFSPIS